VIGITLMANIVAGMFGNIRNVSLSVVRGVSSNLTGSSNSSSSNANKKERAVSSSVPCCATTLLSSLFCSSSSSRTGDDKSTTISSQLRQLSATPAAQVAFASCLLFWFPFIVWMGIPFDDAPLFSQSKIGWDALLHMSVTPLFWLCMVRGLCIASNQQAQALESSDSICSTSSSSSSSSKGDKPTRHHPLRTTATVLHTCVTFPPRSISPCRNLLYIGGAFFLIAVITSQLQVISPNWIWNPFLWGMTVYWPSDLAEHLQGLCLEDIRNHHQHAPLCLNRQAWKVLSAEVLDSNNPADVATVMEGVRNVRDASYGGLILNVMARDTVDAIPALRQNVEALVPFFQRDKLAVVVFENDSKDGTREAFEAWASQADGYKVDVMSCGPEFPDCKYGMSHRYDSTEAKDYFTSSAIGKMSDFRQRIVDYVVNNPVYDNFGHMLVMDLDLQVSLSPLGILHTLGTKVSKDYVVASSGRQTWPGGLGTLMPPYDFSAFRMVKTSNNANMMWLHDQFCALMPPGDRWRNQCDAVSPMQLMLVLGRDRLYQDEPYRVASAFNGATLYPLRLVRDKHATGRYNAGEDGQRCEHIGFNLGLNDYMYINPKWNFHIAPENPGGPTGFRAYRNVVRIVFTPKLSTVIGLQMALCMSVFVLCVMTIGVHLAYPLCLCVSTAIYASWRNQQQQSQRRRYNTNGTTTMKGATSASSSLPLISVAESRAKKGGSSSKNNSNRCGASAPAEYWMMSALLNDLTRRSSSSVQSASVADAAETESVESVITVSIHDGGESASLSDSSSSSSSGSDYSGHKAV
jgi:hypothetical protein